MNPLALIIAAAVIFGAGFYTCDQFVRAAQVDDLEKQISQSDQKIRDQMATFTALQNRDQDVAAENGKLKQSLASNQLDLQAALDRAPLTKIVTKVIHDENGDHSCPVSIRDDTYRLCINAAYSGDSATTATCAAAGGHDGVRSQ